MDSNGIFAGVDCSTGARHLTVAALTGRLDVKFLRTLSAEEAAQELTGYDGIAVAIAAPLRPAAPQVPAPDGKAPRGKVPAGRAPEQDIRRRGIFIRPSPSIEEAATAALRAGFALARALSAQGFGEGEAARKAPRFLLETRAAACAAVLLGRLPFGRATLEGRIQRQLLLIRERVGLPDPMDRLEEMTAHHLLSGRLSLGGILEPGELDALLAAFTAWRAVSQPENVVWLGADSDGCICLPVKQLLDKYIKSDYHG